MSDPQRGYTMIPSRAATISGVCVLGVALLVLSGCDGEAKEGPDLPIRYSDEAAADGALVVIHSDNYIAEDVAARPYLEIYWDGNELYRGRTPQGDGRRMGRSIVFIEVRTGEGEHVLEVKNAGRVQKLRLILEGKEKRHIDITETSNKGELEIEDLGHGFW